MVCWSRDRCSDYSAFRCSWQVQCSCFSQLFDCRIIRWQGWRRPLYLILACTVKFSSRMNANTIMPLLNRLPLLLLTHVGQSGGLWVKGSNCIVRITSAYWLWNCMGRCAVCATRDISTSPPALFCTTCEEYFCQRCFSEVKLFCKYLMSVRESNYILSFLLCKTITGIQSRSLLRTGQSQFEPAPVIATSTSGF